MGNLKLIYFGDLSNISSNLLYLLGLVQIERKTENYSGLYLKHNTEPNVLLKKVKSDISSIIASDEIILIYRYLTEDELKEISSIKQNGRVFVIAHDMLDISFLTQQLREKICLVSIDSKSSFFQNKELDNGFYEIFTLETKNTKFEMKYTANSALPYFLLEFLVLILNPYDELRSILANSNIKILNRLNDLISFFIYLIKVIIYQKIIYFIYYKIIHFVYYEIIHFVYYELINKTMYFIYYEVIYKIMQFLYYKIMYFIYYRVIYFVYYKFYRFFLYQAYRIITYPIFKVYWFLNYQYQTRFKKYVTKNQ